MQEGGYGMNIPNEIPPARVSEVGTKQAGEIQAVKWNWVERSVWNDRMLEALDKGVKGGSWFSLIDNLHWPNKFFCKHGLFSLTAAHASLLQSLKR